jgi:26S proteasome regulatory subunit N1
MELTNSCVPLLTPPDDEAFLQCAAHIYSQHDRYPEALALAVRLNNKDLVQKYFSAPTNPYVLLSWSIRSSRT